MMQLSPKSKSKPTSKARGPGSIPVVDIDLSVPGANWAQALRGHRRGGRRLFQAFNLLGEQTVRTKVLWSGFKRAVGAGHSILGGKFSDEIKDLSAHFGLPERDILVANMAYELAPVGCSTFVQPTAEGPLHARNLDWDNLPGYPSGLRSNVVVVRARSAPAGDYLAVSWPGLFGVFTGLAPGRFSVTVNFVSEGTPNPTGIIWRAARGYWPVAWLVRHVLEEAEDYEEAVEMLSTAPLISPVLLTVAGIQNDERVVIERTPTEWAHRKAPSATVAVCATNHYASPELGNEEEFEDDSEERFTYLSDKLPSLKRITPSACLRTLSSQALFRDITQYQVTMRPKDGHLTVQVPERDGLVKRLCL